MTNFSGTTVKLGSKAEKNHGNPSSKVINGRARTDFPKIFNIQFRCWVDLWFFLTYDLSFAVVPLKYVIGLGKIYFLEL